MGRVRGGEEREEMGRVRGGEEREEMGRRGEERV